MREIGEAELWKIRTFITKMESTNKSCMLLGKEQERLQLEIEKCQKEVELAKANVENIVLYEKKRMNIPDNWIFHAEEGVFKDPSTMSEEELAGLGG